MFAVLKQRAGETVYIPSDCAHEVTTISNGVFLLGGTSIVPGSLSGLARNIDNLQRGVFGGIINPEPEAQMLCDMFSIPVSQRRQSAQLNWVHLLEVGQLRQLLPATTRSVGGTNNRDARGFKRRRRLFSGSKTNSKKQTTRVELQSMVQCMLLLLEPPTNGLQLVYTSVNWYAYNIKNVRFCQLVYISVSQSSTCIHVGQLVYNHR